jgi:hypothetical protein
MDRDREQTVVLNKTVSDQLMTAITTLWSEQGKNYETDRAVAKMLLQLAYVLGLQHRGVAWAEALLSPPIALRGSWVRNQCQPGQPMLLVENGELEDPPY